MLSRENQRWLDEFIARHNRAPRVLHIGNIANNAYNNAKLLNKSGFDCDVICYDYYHIMGCPEWEDADFSGEYGDQFKPNWVAAKIVDFNRPRWFAQGPLLICIDYLIAKRKGNVQKVNKLWFELKTLNGNTKNSRLGQLQTQLDRLCKRSLRVLGFIISKRGVLKRIAASCDLGRVGAVTDSELTRMLAAWCMLSMVLIMRIVCLPMIMARTIFRRKNTPTQFNARASELIDEFANAFPCRSDTLTVADLEMYQEVIPHWQQLFEQYDLVQAYATDPILPLLTEKKPYVAFEHGTLRSHTLGNGSICRLTSLGYRQANHVFITNGDCIEYAHRLGLTRFTPMLHPVDERRIDSIEGDYDSLHSDLNVSHVFLCTLRHDWKIKGTDKYIRALPSLRKALTGDFRVIMTRWGSEIEESIALAESLGVANLIIWSEPLSRRKLIRTLKSVDILFDQLALPHFGATAPEGIAAGVPVIMSYNPASTEWIIPEPAPILSAMTTEEIVSAVLKALDPVWLSTYKREARTWFDKYHSSNVVIEKHAVIYRQLLS